MKICCYLSGFVEYIIHPWSSWAKCMLGCSDLIDGGFITQSNGT